MTSDAIFGLPAEMHEYEAADLQDALERVWELQLASLPPSSARRAEARLGSSTLDAAVEDVHAMKYWFDPIASGQRLRAAVDAVQPAPATDHADAYPDLFMRLAGRAVILTPEGRMSLWMLRNTAAVESTRSATPVVYFTQSVTQMALIVLHGIYRDWSRQRINNVTRLLTRETATLRPTAAGLLLVLLVNRNTSPARRLPSPSEPEAASQVTRAIAAPAIAFARELADSDKASSRGLDLYRGWAMGEISRRLGRGLHRGADGVWIEPEYEGVARRRLTESLRERDHKTRGRIHTAVDSALLQYEQVRPVLSGLGVAHERPSNTRALRAELLAVAAEPVTEGESVP